VDPWPSQRPIALFSVMSTNLTAEMSPPGLAPADDAPGALSTGRDRGRIPWLVFHLVLRELQSEHRFTLLGWLWPLVRQLAQLVVLVFLFSKVFKTGIKDFPLYVFSGLLLWTWFSSGISAATASVLSQRHLLFTPRFPAPVVPLSAMSSPLVDTLMAMPVLLAMIFATNDAHWTLLLVPVVLAVLYLLIAGVSLITAALNVYYRDVYNIVVVGLLMMFYLTPVFYGLRQVPPRFLPLLHANPMTAIVNSMRAVALTGTLPTLRDAGIAVGSAVVLFTVGWLLFARMAPDFVDEL
jgi:lipopolysaccharide transport system permease protein